MATGGAVDETVWEAYYGAVMKLLISRTLALAAILAGAGLPVAAEDLDAALAAQKKKTERRIYSDSAQIENRDLEVPRTPTEEERALDKKLREMDAKIDSQSTPGAMPRTPRPANVVPRPADDKNWLTPALLDNDAAASLTNTPEDTWLVREMERQKELKTQSALLKEKEQTEKLLREKTQPQVSSPDMDRLKHYQLAPQNMISGKDQNSGAPSYMTPRSGTPDPLSGLRSTPRKETPAAPALFSPEAARISSSQDKNLFGAIQKPSLTPNLGSSSPRSPSSGFSSGLDAPDPAPLTPLEMIRKSSPINRPDPFADDHMPKMKNSIWD